jgi:protein-tyrosine kinase
MGLHVPAEKVEESAAPVDIELLAERELIDASRLDVRRVERVRALQQRFGVSFAEAALAMGVVRRKDFLSALAKGFQYTVFTSPEKQAGFSDELVVGFDAFGDRAEEIRSIRASLLSRLASIDFNSMAFISPASQLGASYVCANIALAFAQTGIRTLVVDANLRKPRLGLMFGLDRNRPGLVETILYRQTPALENVAEVAPNLFVLPSGKTPPNPQELLCSKEFLQLVAEFSRGFGVVFYDTASAAQCADGLIVAQRAGAAVIVARRHQTSLKDLGALAATLQNQNCEIVGSVLNA